MTVAQLIKALKSYPQDQEIIVCDGANDFDVSLQAGKDSDLNPCVVIDLTCDCERE